MSAPFEAINAHHEGVANLDDLQANLKPSPNASEKMQLNSKDVLVSDIQEALTCVARNRHKDDAVIDKLQARKSEK